MNIKEISNRLLKQGELIDNPKWQGIENVPRMIEIVNVNFSYHIPLHISDIVELCKPDLPWADDHFQERIGEEPTNPGKTYKYWKFYKEDEKFRAGGLFTHTYQERFWPKFAGGKIEENIGIRYNYGDLNDVIKLLTENPQTRQAYLPIFFPEDTGALHGGRIPCTLGYWFYYRNGVLNCNYYIRSCDIVRHFRNDVYLAMLLTRHVAQKSGLGCAGTLNMFIGSFHCFETDKYYLQNLK